MKGKLQDEINDLFDFELEEGDVSGDNSDADNSDKGEGEHQEDDSQADENNEVSNDEAAPAEGEDDNNSDQSDSNVPAAGIPAESNSGIATELTQVIATLREQNSSLSKRIDELVSAQKLPEKEEEKPSIDKVFDELNLDNILENEDNFKAFMTKFAESIREQTLQSTMNQLPTVTSNVISERERISQVRNGFYEKYPELAPVKKYVASVANDIAESNPNLSMEDVLEQAAASSKETLGINTATLPKKEKSEKQRPSFPKAGGSNRGKKAPQKSALQQELDDFNSDIFN
ncbi:MAG: hypothetical protein ACTSPB_12635 [Candidatus Thorarchaeota archaeon]